LSTYGLTIRVEAMERKINEICDKLGIGEGSAEIKSLRREVQSLTERVHVLELDPVTITESKNGAESLSRRVPKRRGKLQLSA